MRACRRLVSWYSSTRTCCHRCETSARTRSCSSSNPNGVDEQVIVIHEIIGDLVLDVLLADLLYVIEAFHEMRVSHFKHFLNGRSATHGPADNLGDRPGSREALEVTDGGSRVALT